jgi:hypothetical protein
MSLAYDTSPIAEQAAPAAGGPRRMRPRPVDAVLLAQPAAVWGSRVALAVGFAHRITMQTRQQRNIPMPNDTARIEANADAQAHLEELLSQMRALQMEAAESEGGLDAGGARLASQLESLMAEADEVGDRAAYIDRRPEVRAGSETVEIVRRATTTHTRSLPEPDRAVLLVDAELDSGLIARRLVPGEAPLQGTGTRQSADGVDMQHSTFVATQHRLHVDLLGIAAVAPSHYMPVGAALAAVYAYADHQVAWRPAASAPSGTVAPVQQALGGRWL